MNILLLTDFYPPAFAPRMGYLVKYLKEDGHYVEVVSTTKNIERNSFGFFVGYADKVYDIECSGRSHFEVLKDNVKGMLSTFRMMWSDIDTRYYKATREAVSRNRFDCILCSVSSFSPLLVAERISEENGLPMLLDFRDIFEQDEKFFSRRGLGGMMRHFQKNIRNRIISKASVVTSISGWHCTLLSRWSKNVKMIMNGFDEKKFMPQPKWEGEKKRIVYTGNLATRYPTILFEALAETEENKRKYLEVVFYTNDAGNKYVNELANRMGIEDVVHCESWVAADKVPEVLTNSSALLIVTNQGSKGVMTTKAFEYMAMNRPIFCLPDPDSQLERVLGETGTGVTMRDKESVKKYLGELIDGTLEIHPKMDEVLKYSRATQAKQFEELMQEIVGKN